MARAPCPQLRGEERENQVSGRTAGSTTRPSHAKPTFEGTWSSQASRQLALHSSALNQGLKQAER